MKTVPAISLRIGLFPMPGSANNSFRLEITDSCKTRRLSFHHISNPIQFDSIQLFVILKQKSKDQKLKIEDGDDRTNPVIGAGEVESEELDGLERRGGGGVDLINDELVAAEGYIRAEDEAVSLDGVVWREIGKLAVVNGGLVGAQVEIVAKIEEVVWSCCYRCHCFDFDLLCFADCSYRSERERVVNKGYRGPIILKL